MEEPRRGVHSGPGGTASAERPLPAPGKAQEPPPVQIQAQAPVYYLSWVVSI